MEKHDSITRMLEFIRGEGYRAAGETWRVDRLVAGPELEDRRHLALGGGIGGTHATSPRSMARW